MPKNPRVYELARELGLTNKETLELCDALGIGVKSHSSSVVEAQADRVRRKAEREGLIRDEQPEEPKAAKKAAKKKAGKKKAAAKKAAAAKAEPVAAEPEPTPEPAPAPEPVTEVAPPAEPEPAPVVETPEPVAAAAESAPAETPAPPAEAAESAPVSVESSAPEQAAPAAEAPTPPRPNLPPPPANLPPPPKRLVTSSGQEPGRVRPAAAESTPAAPPAAPPPAAAPPAATPPPSAAPEAPAARAEPPRPAPDRDIGAPPAAAPRLPAPPRSSSGKPIPPPPIPPRSSSGKPIPPPPGPPRAGGPSGRPGGGPGRGGPGGRPGGGGGFGGPGGRPGPGGPGMGPGGPGGRPGGPRGAPQRRGRKGKRRRRQREELQPQELPTYTPVDAPVPEGEILIERGSTAQEVAGRLNRSAADVVRFLLQQGEMVTATQSLTDEMVELFAAELGAEIRLVDPGAEQEEEILKILDIDLEAEGTASRPPVITVMGHVDHGKTLLLDRIRSSNVVEGEAGGITQHIGAYQVVRNGHPLTFIDTPGHEAFTAMRARGAQATDIVILVVAADDGVMPQTLEAIDHARAAEVPIVVAINKMDREGADPNRVMAQLAERNLIPESYGGDVITVPVSAMTSEGLDDLLDQILLVAEVEELTSDPDGRATGTVLEANLDKGRGPVATVLVQQGTLRVGDPLVAGAAWGRVRAMIDDRGNSVKEAGPSTPVEVLGLNEVARAGDMFVVAPDEKTASKVADTREHWQRQATMANSANVAGGGAKLEDIFKQIQAGETATLNLVLKADVHGSLEAVTESLRRLERDDVKLAFVSRGVGGINENDVQLAVASNATIIGFNVRPDRKAREAAEAEDIEIRLYEIIYKLLEDIENAMLGMLEPEFEEIVTGEAEVRQVFRISGVGPIAGCLVQHGRVQSGSKVRFLREGTIIWKGAVASLRHFQDAVNEVNAGMECGIGLTDFTDLKEGDVIETYEEREIPRT